MRSPVLFVATLVLLVSACSESTTTTVTTTVATATTTEGVAMELSSPVFEHDGAIPNRFTCDGDNVSPELRIAAIPEEAAALVLIMDDPDAPGGTWDHWVAYDIEPVATIPEDVGNLGTAGLNSWKQPGYGGPCPPSGTHRYFFKILALDTSLGLAGGADKAEVLAAIEEHVIAEAVLMGTVAAE